MSAILTTVFKFTIGLAAAKARDALADRLKGGDVADEKFRNLIASDLKDIKSRLEALSRKDLVAAVEYFDTGLRYLSDAVSYGRHNDTATRKAAQESERNNEKHFDELTLTKATSPENSVVLTAGIQNLQLNEFVDEAAKTALSDAKERFTKAREKATDACTLGELSTLDRITAIRYRVMAAMLEYAADTALGTSGDWKSALRRALPECEQSLEKLNSLPSVKICFKVELEKSIRSVKGLIGRDERKEIISTVCYLNRVIYNAIQAVGGDVHVWAWPYVDIGEDKVDPLRDGRISKVLGKDNVENCCVTPWSFGQKSFVGDTKVKVFDLFKLVRLQSPFFHRDT